MLVKYKLYQWQHFIGQAKSNCKKSFTKLEILCSKVFCFLNKFLTCNDKASSHGLVVKGEALQPRGCGFESWVRILDITQSKVAITLTKKKYKWLREKTCNSKVVGSNPSSGYNDIT